jgi:hypothetical protein
MDKSPIVVGQINPFTDLERPWGLQEFQDPRFYDSWHMKVVRLSALRTGRLYTPPPPPPSDIPVTHLCQKLSQSRGHSEAGRIFNEKLTIATRTCDLPVCSAMPQPTTPPRAISSYFFLIS